MTGVQLDRGLHRLSGVWLVVVVTLIPVCVAGEASEPGRFENASGWQWIVPPIHKQSGLNSDMHSAQIRKEVGEDGWTGFIVLMEEGKDHELMLVFARPGSFRGYYEWRPIAFDVEGERHRLRAHMAVGTDGVMLERWSSSPDTLPASRVTHVGLEGLTAAGLKKEADVAAQRAAKQGLKVLPFPIVGKPYRFEVMDVRGNAIDSDELRGRVVLLDLWATWCFPCMQKMPMIKELYARHHADGFEVLGINFDDDQQSCVDAAEKHQIPWQQVMAPTEKTARDLWMQAMGVNSLPRLLLIDRAGILRADCTPDELHSCVSKLIMSKREGQKP